MRHHRTLAPLAILTALASPLLAQPAKRDANPKATPPAQPAANPAPEPAPAAPTWKVPAFPNPIITEVLFDVPTGEAGDANADGRRHATGDEFIELANPHDKPISLAGFMLTDSAGWPGKTRPNPNSPKNAEREEQKAKAPDKPNAKPPANSGGTPESSGDKPRRGAVRFVFPALVLQPGERVVVFNGFRQEFKGPVGDASRAPEGPNPTFADAHVLTMKIDSNFNSFSNTGDWVALASPRGEAVQVVWWGTPDFLPPEGVTTEEVPTGKESAARATKDGPLMPHSMLPGALGQRKFSPGEFGGPSDSPR
jgi:hypothetical protein